MGEEKRESVIFEQIFWLAINIYHEAATEPDEGKVAVGHVVWNRARERKISFKQVILQPMQFSWHNHNAYPPIKSYDALEDCFQAAVRVIEERMLGKSLDGADHYFADYIKPPFWSRAMKQIAYIGRHIFKKE